MKLTSAVQEALIALLCYDDQSASVVASIIPSTYYDPYYTEIADEAQKYLTAYSKPPKDHTLDLVEVLEARFPEKAEFYRRIFDSLQTTKEGINRDYVLNKASVFLRYQNLKRALHSAIRSLQQEDEAGLASAESALQKGLEVNYNSQDIGVLLSRSEHSLAFLEQQENANSFPTGITALDEKGLGPARKRLHLLIGLAGAGKSFWLAHIAKHAYMARRRVLFITLELSEEEVCQRLMQGLFSISKRSEATKVCRFELDELGRFISIKTGEELKRLSLEDPSIAKLLTKKVVSLKRRPPFIVKQFPTGGMSLKDLENYLDVLESKMSFIPDLLVIDYADLMSIDSKNYRLDLGQLYKKLRGLAVKRNIAVATASQANRAAFRSKWITIDNVGEDFSKIATSDTVITLNQTPVEHELGLARLFVAKGRTDKDKFAVLISQAYGLGQFVLDSTAYSPNYWDDVTNQVTDSVGEE